jgi:FkbM family methyltransferase
MLRLNTNEYSNITVIGKAMNDNSNGLYFVDPGEGSDSFQTVKEFAGEKPVKIESISIQDLMKEYRLNELDFVKIDIEGAEDFCIDQHAMVWINRSKLLAIEIHEHLVPGCTKKIMDLLKKDFKFQQNSEYSIFENAAYTN